MVHIIIPGQRTRARYDHGAMFDSRRQVQYERQANLTDAENVFFENELIHMIPGQLQRLHSVISARTLFPIYNANDPGAEQAQWTMIERLGEADIVDNYADDSPRATTRVGSLKHPVVPIRDHATWTMQDVRAANREGRPLEATESDAAFEAILRKEDSLAFDGDADHGIVGFLGNTDIPTDTAAQTLAAGTAVQNLDTFGDVYDAMVSNSDEHHKPNVLAIAPAAARKVARQYRSDNSDTTVLELIKKQFPGVSVVEVPKFNGAGTGGTDMAAFIKRDITVLRLMVMSDIESFAPERQNLAMKVEWHMRSGGLLVQQPMAIRKIDNL